MLGTILLIVLVLLLLGALPAWPYSSQWGYAPTGILGTLLIILLILLVLGIVPFQIYDYRGVGTPVVPTPTPRAAQNL